MAEISSNRNTVQLGVEVTPGTAATVTKSLGSISFSPEIQGDVSMFTPVGANYPTLAIPGREWVEAKIDGRGTYGELSYLISSAFIYAAPVADGTLPKKWVQTPSLGSDDVVKTYTIEHGNSARARKWLYNVVTALSFKFSKQNGCEVSGSTLGQAITEGATWTSSGVTAAESPLVPIAGSHISVAFATSWTNLSSATVAPRAFSAEFNASDLIGPVWVMDGTNTGFAATVGRKPNITVKVLEEADANGMAWLTNMRAGSTIWMRIKCQGPDIETGKPWLFQIDGCYSVGKPDAYSDQDGVYAIGWNLTPTYDPVASKTIEFTERNKLAGL